MGKFVIKKNNLGFTFNLLANNHEVIATSGEVLSSKATCKKSIESVCKTVLTVSAKM